MSIELSPEIESIVRCRAADEGISVADLITRTFAPGEVDTSLSADPRARVRALIASWQTADNTPSMPPIQTRPGETPSQALFRAWEEEDANMTDEELEQDNEFWQGFQQSIDDERTATGMRTIFKC